MSFTPAERVTIRKYLGWPAFATSETILEGGMDLVGADTDGAASVRTVLSNLATIETQMLQLHKVAIASGIDKAELNPDRYRDLRTAGRREVQSLAIHFRVRPIRDYFSTGWTGGSLPMG